MAKNKAKVNVLDTEVDDLIPVAYKSKQQPEKLAKAKAKYYNKHVKNYKPVIKTETKTNCKCNKSRSFRVIFKFILYKIYKLIKSLSKTK
jgi:hypothetical protein